MKEEPRRRISRLRRLTFVFLVLGSTTVAGLVLLELAAQAHAGREVSLRRRHGVLRILSLGASTTYGWGCRLRA